MNYKIAKSCFYSQITEWKIYKPSFLGGNLVFCTVQALPKEASYSIINSTMSKAKVNMEDMCPDGWDVHTVWAALALHFQTSTKKLWTLWDFWVEWEGTAKNIWLQSFK